MQNIDGEGEAFLTMATFLHWLVKLHAGTPQRMSVENVFEFDTTKRAFPAGVFFRIG